jgi:hypothetical protein
VAEKLSFFVSRPLIGAKAENGLMTVLHFERQRATRSEPRRSNRVDYFFLAVFLAAAFLTGFFAAFFFAAMALVTSFQQRM